SAVPDIGDLLLLVKLPLAGDAITGFSGAAESIVKETASDTGEVLPVPSVAEAVRLWSPSANADEGVKENAPPAVAVVLPNWVLPSLHDALPISSAVPDI